MDVAALPIERSLLGCAIEAIICHIRKNNPTAATFRTNGASKKAGQL